MTEEEWLKATDPLVLISFIKKGSGRAKLSRLITKSGVERRQRLFLVACARRNQALFRDERSRTAIGTVEGYVDGFATAEDLRMANASAKEAYRVVRMTPDIAGYCAACPPVQATEKLFRQGFDLCLYGSDVATMAPAAVKDEKQGTVRIDEAIRNAERQIQASLFRDIFGPLPFRPVTFNPDWRTPTVLALAQGIYEDRAFDRLPILADALQDAGCDNDDILSHMRGDGAHCRGCWPLDLLLGKE